MQIPRPNSRPRRFISSAIWLLAVSNFGVTGWCQRPPETTSILDISSTQEKSADPEVSQSASPVTVTFSDSDATDNESLTTDSETGLASEMAVESMLDAEPVGEDSLLDSEPLAGEMDLSQTPVSRRGFGRRFLNYGQVDLLTWWAGDSTLPRLLVTNPAGTPLSDVGIANSTSTLHGQEQVGDWPHMGIRFRLGRFVPNSRVSRFELDFWHLFEASDSFAANSNGSSSILSRPFINATTGNVDSQVISFPGIASGGFQSEYTRSAWGFDPLVYLCLRSNSQRWLEFYSGYRFLWLEDELQIRERVDLEPGGLIAPGTRFEVEDRFRASNFYHLIPLGLSYTRIGDRWLFNVRGSLGLGMVSQKVRIRGRTDAYAGGTLTDRYDAGFLALRTNRGEHARNRFVVVPEANFSMKRRIGNQTTAYVGYTLICLPNAAKAVDHVPTIIDPGNIPPELPSAGPHPLFAFQDDTIWIHGFHFGVRYDY